MICSSQSEDESDDGPNTVSEDLHDDNDDDDDDVTIPLSKLKVSDDAHDRVTCTNSQAWRSELAKVDVWYASFGSNMSESRFRCYIEGGQAEELAAAVPDTEVVGKGDYFRFGMRDSLAIKASFLQVWDAVTGAKKYTFQGHEEAVYSVCPHFKGNIQASLYDNMGSRVNYDAPGHSSTTMAYSADGTRLFSCGTNKEGDYYIVEWNESEGVIKRTYNRLRKRSVEVVQFDTTKNRFLAAGDEFTVKFWDMDNVNLLTTTDADGGLPVLYHILSFRLPSPCIRFNKEGILMAVTTNDNGITILANPDGIRLLRTMENRPFDPSSVTSVVKPPMMSMFGGADKASVGVGPSFMDRVPQMPSMMMMVSRLIYTNSGLAILALAANAVHKLWKWQRTDNNSTGKRMTTFMAPPPTTTFLASHPQDNNIIAIGMEDSSIQIYNLCVWNTNGWEKQTSKHLQIPAGRVEEIKLVFAGLIAPKERRNGRLIFTVKTGDTFSIGQYSFTYSFTGSETTSVWLEVEKVEGVLGFLM
ncbi:hypothetical protein L2E82_28853 [Cichorium intybus]|uniref:Uncharacterized protein n=1 Tax=Cichorium intybus TaxID=13427 RepID=A0ACB9CX21_CICIN|nr:hypothetical protein L2E82_28853 [Cichorium intybus]